MANITTCSNCGHLFEAGSEEEANEPNRLCLTTGPFSRRRKIMLFRAIYIRDGKPRGITFAYDSAAGAAAFAERFVASLKRYYRDAKLLTVTFARQVGEPRRKTVPVAQRELT